MKGTIILILGKIIRWIRRLLLWIRKLVTPTVTSKVSLSVSQGPTGMAYNLVIVSIENGQPDTTDVPEVAITNPDGSESTITANAPDSTGTSTTPLAAGMDSGPYVYTPTVGGDVQPSVTFTRNPNKIPTYPRIR